MLNMNSLPPFVEVAAGPEERTALERLKSFIQHENLDGVKFPVPKGLEFVAINDGFIHSEDKFKLFNELSRNYDPKGVCFCFPYSNNKAVLKAEITFDLMDWIETEVFESPVVFLFSGINLLLIVDEQLSVTLLAIDKEHYLEILESFGGRQKLRDEFQESLAENYKGSGSVEKKWLEKFILNRCNW